MYSQNNSYIFAVIEGLIDNDNDGYPETPLFCATGDQSFGYLFVLTRVAAKTVLKLN